MNQEEIKQRHKAAIIDVMREKFLSSDPTMQKVGKEIITMAEVCFDAGWNACLTASENQDKK